MPIDSSIAMGFRAPQFESPVNALAQVMQLQHAQSANELQKYGLAKAQRQDSETNALSQLLSSPGFNLQNPSDQARAYGVAPTVATTYIKGMLDNNNTQAQTRERNSTAGYKDSESAQKRTNLVSQAYGYVKQNPTPEAANQVIDTLQLNGVLTAEQASQHKAAVTANPGQIAQMADMLFRGGVSSENQMMKTQNQNIGGATQTLGIDPITGKTQVLNSVNNTQSPDNAANNLTTMRGQNMTSNTAAAGREQSASQFAVTQASGKIPAGYKSNGDGTMSFIPGGPADPIGGAGGKMTEYQGKATGWLIQAENAFKNMKASGFDAEGNRSGSAKPGFNDALGAVPGLGGLANSMRGEGRQKFIQSSSSLSEALLRAATGAGVNESEARQKIQELTPLFGEAESVTKQKMDAIPLYIESLKVRAGPGAKKAAGVLNAPSSNIDALLNKYK